MPAGARAVAKRPDVLLCDEPAGALDSETGELVPETIARAKRELDTTTVVITHDAAIAAMAERVLHLADGRIVAEERNAVPARSCGSPLVKVLGRVLRESGGVVAPGTPLLEIAGPKDLEIVVDVLTSDAVRIPTGAPVQIDRWGGEAPLAGRVRLVEPSGFTKLSALRRAPSSATVRGGRRSSSRLGVRASAPSSRTGGTHAKRSSRGGSPRARRPSSTRPTPSATAPPSASVSTRPVLSPPRPRDYPLPAEEERAMRVGMTAIFQNPFDQRPDRDVYRDDVALATLAEPLGFDSVWGVEHHFTDYTMCPDVLQFLTFVAGRTRHVQLGSMVVVLPWHDPLRVAEQFGRTWLKDGIVEWRCGARTGFGIHELGYVERA
jgi:hypothetical protein